jgi:hypothetical protein
MTKAAAKGPCAAIEKLFQFCEALDAAVDLPVSGSRIG